MRFWFNHALYPLLAFAIFVIVFKLFNLDIKIASIFFNYELKIWTFGESWWAKIFIHKGGRTFVALILLASLLGLLLSLFVHRLKIYRRVLIYISLTILLATGAVALLQQLTNVDCPWDLSIFNGSQPYFHLFDDKTGKVLNGVCFPGGHASGGFSLLLFYFVCRYYEKSYALTVLLAMLLIGSTYGLAQWVRGAHFVTHDYWSAMICWLVALGLYALILKREHSRKDE